MAEKNKPSLFRQFINFISVLIFLAIIIGASAYLITSWLEHGIIIYDTNIFYSEAFLNIFVILFLFALVFVLFNIGDGKGLLGGAKSSGGGAKVKTKGKISKFYDTNWLSIDQLKKDSQFKFHTYDQLSRSDNIGIPIRAELIGRKLEINMYKSIHTLVIGTTGSGKTTQFADPTIQILGESHARPGMVITDPKGELYDRHSEKLRERGYKVLVFDLKEPFQSTCWNPMARSYDLNKRAENLKDEVIVHQRKDPRSTNLVLTASQYYRTWYQFDGMAFADEQSLKVHMESVRQRLKNEAFEDLRDITTTLAPVQSTTDPIWERGAKDLILGTMLAMLEDSENPELDMTRDRFNFFNLSRILNLKDNDAYNPIRSITEYFQGRSTLSLAVQLANQVVSNTEKTAKNYMGIVTDRMGIFSDAGVCYATSVNEMELETFAERPTALFIKIPDEKITRHPIATMFVSQLYKILVDVANKSGGALPRDVYFLLDEFGNMPKIENFDTIITVARSRRIYFTLILQSYAQLQIKYGSDVSATIKDNCNIHVFLASNDQNTLEEFSKRCGNITVETENISASKGKDDKGSTTTSINIDSRPLIYPAELAAMKPNSGECIVSILQQSPLRSKFTPSYKVPLYTIKKPRDIYKVPRPINEEEMYYDIRKRNSKILRGPNDKKLKI